MTRHRPRAQEAPELQWIEDCIHGILFAMFTAVGMIVTGLVTAWVILHPRQTPLMDDAKVVQDMIGAGTPVLLEFQSPY